MLADIHNVRATQMKNTTGRRIAQESGRIYHVEFNPPQTPDVCDESGEALIQRADDRPEAIRERLASYHSQTEPLIPYYEGRGLLKVVEGTGLMPDEVSARIWEILG